MYDDTLVDVFRLLSRKQLSQSVALVCRRFRYSVNSPILPNLHYIINGTGINPHFKCPLYPARKEWGFVMSASRNLITYEELHTTHRPTQYLRFAHLNIRPEHLAKEQWRKCLCDFRHCFAGCTLKLDMHVQFTALEFQCFLADWILRLFPNCIYFIEDCTFISSTDNKREDLPTLEERANFNKSKFLQFAASERQAVVSCFEPSLLITHPSLFNCSYVKIKMSYLPGDRCCDSFVPQEDVIEWLHHVPAESTALSRKGIFSNKRFLLLSSAMLKPHKEDRRDDWCQEIAQASNSVVEQIKKFLVAKTLEEKREFYLELDASGVLNCSFQRLKPFNIRNDATNERLTFDTNFRTYTLSRKSA